MRFLSFIFGFSSCYLLLTFVNINERPLFYQLEKNLKPILSVAYDSLKNILNEQRQQKRSIQKNDTSTYQDTLESKQSGVKRNNSSPEKGQKKGDLIREEERKALKNLIDQSY